MPTNLDDFGRCFIASPVNARLRCGSHYNVEVLDLLTTIGSLTTRYGKDTIRFITRNLSDPRQPLMVVSFTPVSIIITGVEKIGVPHMECVAMKGDFDPFVVERAIMMQDFGEDFFDNLRNPC